MRMRRKHVLPAYVALVAFAAAVVTVVTFSLHPPQVHGAGHWLGVAALIGAVVSAEVAGVRFSAGAAMLSASLIPVLTALPLFGSATAVGVALLSAVTARVALRQRLIKAVFNTAQATLNIGLAGLVYVALAGPVSPDTFDLKATLAPFIGLVLVYFVANTVLVSTVVALDTERPLLDVWKEIAAVAGPNDLASSSLALFVIYAFTELGIGGLLVVLLPLLFVHHSYALYVKLQRQNKEILELLVKTIEAKDPYTSGHSQRVAWLTKGIAQTLGKRGRALEAIETAALLHDIGKVDFAYSGIIAKPSDLSKEEREAIRSHPERGAKLLMSISSLTKDVLDAVRYHHEHWDGGGYPNGLSGEEIPLAARIIMVADTVDAMLSHRPYRRALRAEDVRDELERFAGRQFDPAIVAAVLGTELIEMAARRAQSDRVGAEDITTGRAKLERARSVSSAVLGA